MDFVHLCGFYKECFLQQSGDKLEAWRKRWIRGFWRALQVGMVFQFIIFKLNSAANLHCLCRVWVNL